MRRLSLLLLLLLLLCALPALAAEKPFTLTDDTVIPDSVTRVSATVFPVGLAGCGAEGTLLPISMVPPFVAFWETDARGLPGRASAGVRVPVYTGIPAPWHGRLVPVSSSFERRAWALVGVRFRVASPRQLKRLVCKGRLVGVARGRVVPLSTPRLPSGPGEGLSVRVDFGIWGQRDWVLPSLSTLSGLSAYRIALLRGQPPSNCLLEGGAAWSGFSINHPCWYQSFAGTMPSRTLAAFRAPIGPVEEAQLDFYWRHFLETHRGGFGQWVQEARKATFDYTPWELQANDYSYLVALLLDVAVIPNHTGFISDTDLDFSSGDYGAYFDSLEIELEPVKKSAKS